MQVTFIKKDGTEKTVSFKEGDSLLQTAEQAGVRLNSFCEGQGICGACHVIIENLHEKFPEPSLQEQDLLDKIPGSEIHSRLACQIILNVSLDGLRVKIN